MSSENATMDGIDSLKSFVQRNSTVLGLRDSKKENLPPLNGKYIESIATTNLQHLSKLKHYDDLSIEIASVCFTCLGFIVKGYDESVELVRNHQLFVIKLIEQKQFQHGLNQLNCLYDYLNKFLHGRKTTSTVSGELFRGIPYVDVEDEHILKLVIAWHFFLLQVLVQFISSNMKLFVRNSDSLWNHSILELLAQLFLHSSNFQKWLKLSDKMNSLGTKKHHTNCVKIIRGLLKITDTVVKHSKNNCHLKMVRTCFILKLIELDNDLSLKDEMIIEPQHLPFIDDLRNHHLFLEISSRLDKSSINDIILVLQTFVKSRDPKLINHLHLQLINATSDIIHNPKVTQLIKSFHLDASPITFAFLDVISTLLQSSNLSTGHYLILDSIILFVNENLELMDYHQMMYSILFKLSTCLEKSNQFKRLRNVSNLLYNMGNRSRNALFWKASIDIEITILNSSFTEESFSYSLSKAQKVVNALYELKYLNEAKHVLKSIFTVIDKFKSQKEFAYPVLTHLLVQLSKKDVDFIPALFSELSESTKVHLTISLLQSVDQLTDLKQKSLLINFLVTYDYFCPESKFLVIFHYYGLDDIEDDLDIDLSPANDLLVAGICLRKLIGCTWQESLIFEAITRMEKWLTEEQKEVTPLECDIFKLLIQTLKFNGATKYVVKFIKLYQLNRSPEPSFSIYLQLELCNSLLHCEPREVTESMSHLKDLLKEYNINSIQEIISFNLLQFEYLISTGEVAEAQERFNKITRFMESREEFKLRAKNGMNLVDRLGNLLIIAKFQYLTAKFNSLNKKYADAYSNCKVCIKLLYSIVRGSLTDIPKDKLRGLKWDTNLLLFDSLKIMMKIILHLGITRDLLYYLFEFQKLNDANFTPIINAYNTLYLITYFQLLDRKEDIELSLDMLRKLQEIGLVANDLGIIKLFNGVLLLIHKDDLKSITLQDNLVQISGIETDEFDFEYLSSLGEKNISNSCSNRISFTHGILQAKVEISNSMKALSVIPEFSNLPNFSIAFPCIVNDGLLDPNYIQTDILNKLVQCKNGLFAGLDNVSQLSTYALKDFHKVVNHCLLILSSMTVCKMNSTLLIELFYLQDFANHLPFQNDKLLNHRSSGMDDLLPGPINIPIQNNDFKSLAMNFNVDLNLYLPSNWAIVHIDVCDFTGDILISKYTKGGNPLFLRLPLARYRSRSVNVKSFRELEDCFKLLIKKSNQSTKASITSSIITKEDRKEWWKLRFSLDLELKELLEHVERYWFGGFSSIFNNYETDSVFKKFKLDFINLVNKMLPSRIQKIEKFMEFDDNIVRLFYESHSEDKSCLDDLLYFLVDSLNLHGEINNYDNLTRAFSESVQKLIDKYQIIRTSFKNEHLVLIPGVKCSFFPWESMICLRNKSVSRLPSVHSLLEMVKRYPHGMKVNDKSNLYYLINPGADLQRTEQRFKDQFASVERWKGLVGQRPEEEPLITQLILLDLFVYLGHGGCDQYMKTASLYRTCLADDTPSFLPPSLLIGCSSGAIQMNGLLEPNGNIFNWLTCGSPMVMVNLWDVTDKDIDLFAKSIFDKWGLFDPHKKESICDSVSQSRDCCTLKYLNGSAPVIYGLPLVIN